MNMLASDDYTPFMDRCLRAAKTAAESGDYPLAALVVVDGVVIADGASSLIHSHDPSAHPEMLAIRGAAEKLGSRYIESGVLVTTLEPCPMCASAVVWAKMSGIVFGSYQEDALAWTRAHPHPLFTWRQIRVPAVVVADAGVPRPWVVGGVHRRQCNSLFSLVGMEADL
jgi:tRNA(adenine34) deaminase